MRWLVLSVLIVSCLAGALDDAFSNDAGFESIDKTGSESKRAIDDNAAGNKEEKFNIYVGTIDGVRRIIFNEVDGGDKEGMGQPDHGEPFDRFGAYDDNNVIAQENEKSIFVPRPYRPTPKTTEAPTTTTTTTTTTRPPTTRRPLPTQPPQPPRVVTPQTPARVPFEPVTRPTFQQPPRQQPIAPFAPQTVQPQQPNRQLVVKARPSTRRPAPRRPASRRPALRRIILHPINQRAQNLRRLSKFTTTAPTTTTTPVSVPPSIDQSLVDVPPLPPTDEELMALAQPAQPAQLDQAQPAQLAQPGSVSAQVQSVADKKTQSQAHPNRHYIRIYRVGNKTVVKDITSAESKAHFETANRIIDRTALPPAAPPPAAIQAPAAAAVPQQQLPAATVPEQDQQPQFQSRTRRPPFQPVTAAPAPFTQAPRQPAFTQPPPSVDTQGGLRSGVCQSSIFYISTPITGPTRLSFTHFAIAVTVDQCARTCHEFNCAIAHYNPINGHCEFNPSTAFAIRNGQCPAWPSLHYRNNVVASEPVRIFCATCQRPRRRNNGGASTTGRRVGFNRQFDARGRASQQGIFRGSRFPRERPSVVIHGTLLRQPQAISLSQSSFLGLVSAEQAQQSSVGGESRARARGATTQLVSSPISIEVGEDQDDIPIVRRIDSREN